MIKRLMNRPAFWFGVLLNTAIAFINLGLVGWAVGHGGSLTIPLVCVTFNTSVVYALVRLDQVMSARHAEHVERLRELTARASLQELLLQKLRTGELMVSADVESVGRRDH